jgi:CDP-diacylglycerol--glycerol-3-phosphate 3-phosphatidyltransferase
MQSENPPATRPASFTDRMRAQFKGVLEAAGAFFNRLGISPNTMTLFGLLGSTLGAVLLALGHIPAGGWVILLSGAADAIDGTMARLRGKTTRFGAFLDSTTDRFEELFAFGALALFFALGSNPAGVAAAFAAAIGSVMVSYEKARAEALGYECYMVLCPLLILNLPLWAAVAVAVLGNFTALQRIWHVYSLSRRDA